MASCPNCGKKVPPLAAACPNCGYPQKQAQAASPKSRSTGYTSPRNLAYYSIICGIAGWALLPLPLWIVGSVLGIVAITRGEYKFGVVGLILGLIGIFFATLIVLSS